jgi:rhodanese-related sulfurtransferase
VKPLALLLTAVLLPFVASQGGEAKDKPEKAAKFADISHEELLKAVESKSVTAIDVNGTESWKQGHIPGAIDFEASKDKLAALLPADKGALIVAYCGGPMCKAYKEAAKAAAQLGYTNVKHYSGGISGWKKASAPLATGDAKS